MKVHCSYHKLLPTDSLSAYPKNRNSHPPEQIERLSRLLLYQGCRAPIVVVANTNTIAKGHGTWMALKGLGCEEVPVVYQEFESEDQLYAFVQSDNAISAWSEFDLSAINIDVPDLGILDIDLLGIEDFKVDVSELPEREPKEKPEKLSKCPNCGHPLK